MVIAMTVMLMMKVTVYHVIHMISVWNGLVATARAVLVVGAV
ncbi:MAG: hypothetical protein WCC92_07130 [Candidatus Korobacteraceae bacterium]